MEAYLDNSATTRCYEEVKEIMTKTMTEDYGNPSSMHRKGVAAEQYVKSAMQQIARTLKVSEKEIYFTSGGTESNNWALIGTAMANRRSGDHIITTCIEHPSVSAPVDFLEEQGFLVTRIGTDKQGRIKLDELRAAVTKETILISVIYVNNEIGSVQSIEEIGAMVHELNPNVIFHVDAIQAYGKYQIHLRKMKIDLLSASGHKIHGPKGIGFLYVSEKVKMLPLIYGGGQQKGMRSGTDNVPGIAGLGCAAQLCYQQLKENADHMYGLKNHLVEGLKDLEDVDIHGMDIMEGAPHIVSAAFRGVRSEVILHTLEDREIYISAGSACAAHKRSQSPTLAAIGADSVQLQSTVRFSFCETTTREEIDYTLSVLKEVLPMLRRYTRH